MKKKRVIKNVKLRHIDLNGSKGGEPQVTLQKEIKAEPQADVTVSHSNFSVDGGKRAEAMIELAKAMTELARAMQSPLHHGALLHIG
jgi:hypothetical protein